MLGTFAKNSLLGRSVSFFLLCGEVFQGFVEFAGEGHFVAMERAHGGAVLVHFFDGAEGPRRERPVEQLGRCLALAVDQYEAGETGGGGFVAPDRRQE
jgi:hypothetical protein